MSQNFRALTRTSKADEFVHVARTRRSWIFFLARICFTSDPPNEALQFGASRDDNSFPESWPLSKDLKKDEELSQKERDFLWEDAKRPAVSAFCAAHCQDLRAKPTKWLKAKVLCFMFLWMSN